MIRLRFPSALGLLAALAALTTAQPGSDPPPVIPGPVLVALPQYVGDEGVQKELKLTPDQVKRLLAHRKKEEEQIDNTAPKDLKYDELDKALVAEWTAALTPDQLKRARQLAAQVAWRPGEFGSDGFGGRGDPRFGPDRAPADPRQVSAEVLAQYPEIAAALGLDPTQKKLVEQAARSGLMPNSRAVFLSPAQTAAARELFGVLYTGTLVPEFGGPDFGFGGPPAAGLGYTAVRDVQKELKLTDEQATALAELSKKLGGRLSATRFGTTPRDSETVSPAEARKQREAAAAEAEAGLAAILTPAQRDRLRQIERQRGGGGMATEFNEGSELGKHLGVTDAQRKVYAAAGTALAERTAKIVLSADPLDAAKTALVTARKEYDEAVAAVLTPEQQAKKKDWFGAPFTGRVFDDRDPRGGTNLNTLRELVFGRYTLELNELITLRLATELKLTPEQRTKLTAAQVAVSEKFLQTPPDDLEGQKKAHADRSAAVEKALGEILTKEQSVRFRQLMMQWFESGNRLPYRYSVPSAASYPGVAEAIKLTDEQRKKLVAGEPPAGVLTDDQKKAIKDLLGEPANVAKLFARPGGGGFPGGPGGGGFGGPAMADTLRRATFGRYYSELNILILYSGLRDELKLTDEQLKKVREAYSALNEKFRAQSFLTAAQEGEGEKLEKLLTERSAFVQKSLTEILSKEQLVRLRELMIQQAEASRSGPGGRSEFAVRVIGAVNTAAGLPGVAEAIKLTDEQRKKLIAGEPPAGVLTDEQKKAIKEMAGKPADLARVFARPFGTQSRSTGLSPDQQMAMNTAVWGDLKLTDEQIGKLAAAANEYTLASPPDGPFGGWSGGFGGGRPADPEREQQARQARQEKARAATEAFVKALEATLTPAQRARLGQLVLQQTVANSLADALAINLSRVPGGGGPGGPGGAAVRDPVPTAVGRELGLSAEQLKKIAAAVNELDERAGLLQQLERAGLLQQFVPVIENNPIAQARVKLREMLDERVMNELTPEQRAKWKEIVGAPFAGFTKTPLQGRFGGRGPGSFGGFGGPGGS